MADCWTPSFFKILLNPSSPHMRLPDAFVRKHLKDTIPNNPTLEAATGGYSWEVKIEKIGESYCFTEGWNSVVRDARLGFGHFLVFKMVTRSAFKVSIFSPNGCEVCLPSPIINIDDDDGGDLHVHGDDDDDDDDDDGDLHVHGDDDVYEVSSNEEEEDDDDGDDPSLTIYISKIYKYFMWLPLDFAKLAGIGDQKAITVKNADGQEWEIGLRSEKYGPGRRHCLSAGWCEFQRKNLLSDGDKCLFKYIKNEGKLILCLIKKVSKKRRLAKTPVTEVVKRKRGRPPTMKAPVIEVVKRKRGRPFKNRYGVS